jgi:hypothetical protein
MVWYHAGICITLGKLQLGGSAIVWVIGDRDKGLVSD